MAKEIKGMDSKSPARARGHEPGSTWGQGEFEAVIGSGVTLRPETCPPTKRRRLLVSFGGRMGSGKDTAADILEKIAFENKVNFVNMRFAGNLRKAIAAMTRGKFTVVNTQTTAEKATKLPEGTFGATLAEAQLGVMMGLEVALGKRVCAGPLRAGDDSDMYPVDRGIILKSVSIITGNTYTADTPLDAKIEIAPEMTVGKLLQLFGTDVGRNLFGESTWINAVEREWREWGYPPTILRDQRFSDELAKVKDLGGLPFLMDADLRLAAGSKVPVDGRSATHASETSLGEIPRSQFAAVIPNNGTLEELEAFIRKTVWPIVARALE